MATEEELRAASEEGLLADWSPCTAGCPACHRETVEVRQVYRAKPIGTWSLAGVQAKFPVTLGWEYRCTSCGKTGAAEPT
jgi:lysyl-tRNA synthetase class I